jgi:hypothetical protein
MFRRTVFEAVLLICFISFSVASFKIITVEGASTQPRIFRLLAIEQMFDSYRMKSAQFLIKELLKYPNWNNSTSNYVSYIHLVSMYNYSEVFDEVKPFWIGNLYSVNLKDEIMNFLGTASPGELVILYYCGHSYIVTTPSHHSEFLGISQDKLRGWVNSTLSHAYLTLVLDTCYSGFWIDFSSKSTMLVACGKYQMAWGGEVGFFTMGLVEGFHMANDSNNDGWLSVAEVFPYAKNWTETFVTWASQNPESYYSLVEGDIPIIQRDETKPFPTWDIAILSIHTCPQKVEPNSPMTINVTVENQGEKPANFGVRLFVNSSSVSLQEAVLFPGERTNVNFVWYAEGYGKYFLNATVSICPGELDVGDNSYREWQIVTVAFLADLNMDGYVGIDDIMLAAEAFGETPDRQRWNPAADQNEDGYIGIEDIFLIAANFGKTYP